MTVPVQNTTPLYTGFGTSHASNAFGSAPTAGNSLIAIVSIMGHAAATVNACVDSLNNSGWVPLVSGTLDADNDNVFVWVLPSLVNVGAGQTVTFTMSTNVYCVVTVYEVPPVNATPLDGSASKDTLNSAAQPNSGNLSTTASNDIVFSVVSTDSPSAPTGQPTGYSALITGSGAAGFTSYSWKSYSSPQTNINPTWSGMPSDSLHCSTLTFGVNFTSPAPTLTSVTPPSVPVNNGNTLITCAGTGFVSGAVINLADIGNLTTTFVNSTTVTATVTQAQLTTIFGDLAGSPTNCKVTNPDTQATGNVSFTVTAAVSGGLLLKRRRQGT
jgi:hypothetical protein